MHLFPFLQSDEGCLEHTELCRSKNHGYLIEVVLRFLTPILLNNGYSVDD